jgi:hypothetical protein
MAGMAARAKVGVGGLDEAVALLEDFHADDVPPGSASRSPTTGSWPRSRSPRVKRDGAGGRS